MTTKAEQEKKSRRDRQEILAMDLRYHRATISVYINDSLLIHDGEVDALTWPTDSPEDE